MQHHIDQAIHNQRYHDQVHQTFPNEFFDWKITSLFYIAIHLLQALAIHRGKNIGESHEEINKNIRPPKRQGEYSLMPISRSAYDNYHGLYRYSQSARYDGIDDPEIFEDLKRVDYQHCLKLLHNFKLYVSSQSGGKIDIDPPSRDIINVLV